MTIALHFSRVVGSAGLFEGRGKLDCLLEPPGPNVPRECFIFLTGGVAGELLCDSRTPFDSEGAQVDQQMISERGGEYGQVSPRGTHNIALSPEGLGRPSICISIGIENHTSSEHHREQIGSRATSDENFAHG